MFFQTKSSVYYVDEINKTIWGGKLGRKKRAYISIEPIMVGTSARCLLLNGSTMVTSAVTNIHAH